MQQWEYKILNVEKAFYSSKADQEIEQLLNELGQDGWELVGYVTFKIHMLAFKRPIPLSQHPQKSQQTEQEKHDRREVFL